MNKVCKIFLMLLTISAMNVFGGELTVTVSPNPLLMGEESYLNLTFSGRNYPKVYDLPDIEGLKWLSGTSSRRMNNNGFVTTTTSYCFVATRKGKLKIPAMKVDLGSKKVLTKAFEVKVFASKYKVTGRKGNSSTVTIDDLLFSTIEPISDKKEFYVGEDIPLQIKLYYSSNVNVDFSWPQLDIENVSYKDFSDVNPKNEHLTPQREKSEIIDGQRYRVFVFNAVIRPLAAGKINGSVVTDCNLKIPKKRRDMDDFSSPFFDDFFSPFFDDYKIVKHQIKAEFKGVVVKKLPAAPTDKHFLGLVGDWKIEGAIKADKFKVGESFTFNVNITGNGNLDTLTAPELSIDKLRIYPAEKEILSTSSTGLQKAVLRYVAIPLQPGKVDFKCNLSFFDPVKKKYHPVNYSKSFNIEKSEAGIIPSHQYNNNNLNNYIPPTGTKKQKVKRPEDILYLKKEPAGKLSLPLWKNKMLLIILMFALGPLIWGISELIRLRRRMIGDDPLIKRKLDARNRKGDVLRSLKNSDDSNIAEIINREIVPYINDMLSTPPGTTASELADKVEDSDLAECLKAVESSSYMPGAVSMETSILRNKLLNSLKKLVVLLLAFVSFSVAAELKEAPVKSMDEALAAYDNGEFERSYDYFKNELDLNNPDPAIFYNLGNCLYQKGEFAKALVCFERVRRLLPRDSDNIENLNLVRRKLLLPEINKYSNPIELIVIMRDHFRQDEWIAVVAFSVLLLGIGLALRPFAIRKCLIISSIAIALFVISMSAYLTQARSFYSERNAIIVGKRVSVYSIPSNKTGIEKFKLNSGDEVSIEEERLEWCRIRTDNSEGWIKRKALSKVWEMGH